MSADTTPSQFLDGETTDDESESRQREASRGHLTTDRPDGSPSEFSVTKSREWWCEQCSRRVTVSADGSSEYGHRDSCAHALGGDE